ncbi:MAG TPA: thiol reductant ABC exporter subunit CydC [Micromonosporaceae bacterium]|nr:thiol reductant ABC exporter subunit CydC [Micromonosporaceae bacterium]
MRVLLSVARPAAGRLTLAVLAGLGAATCAIGLMAASAWLISRAALHPPVLYLMVAIVSVRAFGIGRGVLRYLERLAGHDAAYRVMGELRARTYEGIERGGFGARRAGDVVARLVSDLDTVAEGVTRVVVPYLVAAATGVASVLFLGALLPPVGVVVFAGLLLVGAGVPLVQAAAARRAERRLAPLRGELTAQIVELVHGAPDLLAYGAAGPRVDAALETDRGLRAAAARSSGGLGLGGLLVAFAGGASVWAALALGTPAVRSGALDGVLLAVVVLTPMAVFEAMSALPMAAAHLGGMRSALARITALSEQPAAVVEAASPRPLPPAPYRVRLESVTAGWRPNRPVVTDFDLDLRPGRRVALVGPSGSGKSTIAALLVRFLDPSAGRLTVNGIDAREFSTADLRRVVGLVTEDAHVFDTTIEENLRIARPDATEAQMRDALRRARLLDWVETLPDGLRTPVGERGAKLSGGQRRRLALARALLAGFPVLVLDEPTEHLDDETAQAVTADLLEATRDRAVLLITHQPFGLDEVDELIRLPGSPLIGTTAPAAAVTNLHGGDARAARVRDLDPVH